MTYDQAVRHVEGCGFQVVEWDGGFTVSGEYEGHKASVGAVLDGRLWKALHRFPSGDVHELKGTKADAVYFCAGKVFWLTRGLMAYARADLGVSC